MSDMGGHGWSGRGRVLLALAATTAVILAGATLANGPVTAGGLTTTAPTIGAPAPDVVFTAIDGRTIRLADARGRAVWITFGASWCQPCRAEYPDIETVARDVTADHGITIVAVFVGEDARTVGDYAGRAGLSYPVVADPRAAQARQFGVVGFPTHVFIDAAGIVRQVRLGTLDVPAMQAALAAIQP